MAKCITLGELIAEVRALKPGCAFDDKQLLSWVNEIEGMVQTEVMLLSVDDLVIYGETQCEEHDADEGCMTHELLVAFPHSKLYRSYLMAMIDFANGEYDKYQNSMAMFNAHWSEFVKWFARNYRPADMKRRGN